MLKMVGQSKLKEQFRRLNKLPQGIILLGPNGSGRKTFSKWIAENFELRYVSIGNKINDIRQLIEDCGELSKPTLYFITDADNLTVQAANAMLKVTEEPPSNLYIVLGLNSVSNILPTILSRVNVFTLDTYSYNELKIFFDNTYGDKPYREKLLNIATSPGNIQDLVNHDFLNILDYVDLVYRNILLVSTGNSFKIGKKITTTDEDDKIPVELFIQVFIDYLRLELLAENNKTQIEIICNMIWETAKCGRMLSVRGAKKELIFDNWILNIRKLRGIL